MEVQKIKSYCSSCRSETNHSVLFENINQGDWEEFTLFKQVVECLGCENVSFRTEEHDYWDVDLEDDEEIGEKYKITVQLFPMIIKGHSEVKNLYTVPSKIAGVYSQTILALKGHSNLLAGVGFRAVIEAICIQEKIKGNNLEIKINNLAKNRLITEREAERLHTIRFLGNDSVHEMEIPTEGKLMLVLDIIESLLKNLYILDKEAKSILDNPIALICHNR